MQQTCCESKQITGSQSSIVNSMNHFKLQVWALFCSWCQTCKCVKQLVEAGLWGPGVSGFAGLCFNQILQKLHNNDVNTSGRLVEIKTCPHDTFFQTSAFREAGLVEASVSASALTPPKSHWTKPDRWFLLQDGKWKEIPLGINKV